MAPLSQAGPKGRFLAKLEAAWRSFGVQAMRARSGSAAERASRSPRRRREASSAGRQLLRLVDHCNPRFRETMSASTNLMALFPLPPGESAAEPRSWRSCLCVRGTGSGGLRVPLDPGRPAGSAAFAPEAFASPRGDSFPSSVSSAAPPLRLGALRLCDRRGSA